MQKINLRICFCFLLAFSAPWRLFISSTSAAELDNDWKDLQQLLAPIKGICTTQPHDVVSSKYTAGMLLGNGDLGVVAGDSLTSQKFYFGKNDFLGQTYDSARDRWGDSIIPIGSMQLKCSSPSVDPAAAFRMEQDILNAEVRTTMQLGNTIVHMRSWTADSDNIFITELACNPGSELVTITMQLQETPNKAYPSSAGVTDNAIWVTRQNDDHTDVRARVALAVKLIGATMKNAKSDASSSTAEFELSPQSPVTLVMAVRGDTKFGNTRADMDLLWESAVKRAAEITADQIKSLGSEHKQWWKDFWLKSYVRVYDDVLEKYYYGALYALGCCARAGHLTPSMFGSWITDDSPRWGARQFLNYNAEAPYYGIASSNRPDMILPYSDSIVAELPFQTNRTHAAGYKGTQYQRSMSTMAIYRPKPDVVPVAAEKNYKTLPTDQKSNGIFAALPMIMYWEYTRDDQFLRDKLYPLLKSLDEFWRDYMDKEQLPGGGYRYVINHTGAHEFDNAADAVDVNPNLDLGFIRTECRTLIDASKELNVDADMIPVWQDMLDHLSDYPTGMYDGLECFRTAEVRPMSTTRPTSRPGNFARRRGATTRRYDRLIEPNGQPVNMEGAVHPGENVALGGDPHLIQVGLNSLQIMQPWGLGGGSANNGFVKEWPQAVRLGWPAADLIDRFKQSIQFLWRDSNLTCFQGGGGIETSGTIDAINSMLLQSNFDELRLFPVWPKDRDAYFVRLRAKGAFVVSSSFTNGQVDYIDITSEKGRQVKIANPWPDRKADLFDITENPHKTVTFSTTDGMIEFDTTAGRRYYIAPSAP